MRRLVPFAALALLAFCTLRAPAMSPDEQKQYLEKFKQIMPPVQAFTDWQQKTGALPPDFDALPKDNGLPDPFKFLDGRPVQMPRDWNARRAEIRQLFEKYVLGKFPPKPKLDQIEIAGETPGQGFLTRNVVLHFGPESKGIMHATVVIPDGPGPFPVLLSPGAANAVLLRRGYIGASYRASDGGDDAASLADLYPEYDFATLPRRAWAAQMVIDYLQTLPQVDMQRIGVFGYSRDGKMATLAAMLDERISALIAGSAGVGGVLPWRLSGESGMGESIESTTRMFPSWFAPQFRFFCGREDRLPVDANLLVALIAPRAVLMEYGLNDEVSNSWGNEQAYHAMFKVYDKLGKPDRLGILRVPGVHGANDMEACVDFLDIQFGRSSRPWVNNFLFPWDYGQWLQRSGEKIDPAKYSPHQAGDLLTLANGAKISSTTDWETKAAGIRDAEKWILGDAPLLPPPPAARGGRGFFGRATASGPSTQADARGGAAGFARGGLAGARGRGTPGQTTLDVPTWVIGRTTIAEFGWLAPERDQTASRKISFGYNVTGDLYYPTDAPPDKKLPTVIWLHGYSYPLGYMWVYRVDLHPILALVKAGYAVLAFDQSGFGSRMSEAGPFYDRFPHWSEMGRMVEDTRAAIDALQKDALVDPDKIYLFGYSMGGAVALHTAALEPRVKGVVSISGFAQMRTDTPDKGTGGIARLSHERGLLPRLGFFVGQESRIPYDFHELIATIAPRPVYVMQAQMDREATASDVHDGVEQARKVYGLYNASDKLVLDEPWDYGRLPTVTQDRIIDWMSKNMQ
jgi:pimeloyl-ACP methyl ester carboxylesterase